MDEQDIEKAVLARADWELSQINPLKLWRMAAAAVSTAGISGVISVIGGIMSVFEHRLPRLSICQEEPTEEEKKMALALEEALARYAAQTGRSVKMAKIHHGLPALGITQMSVNAITSYRGVEFFTASLAKKHAGYATHSPRLKDALDYMVAHEMGHWNNGDHLRDMEKKIPPFLGAAATLTALGLVGLGLDWLSGGESIMKYNILAHTGPSKDPTRMLFEQIYSAPFVIAELLRKCGLSNASFGGYGTGALSQLFSLGLQAGLYIWSSDNLSQTKSYISLEYRADLHHAKVHGLEKTIRVLFDENLKDFFMEKLAWSDCLAAPSLQDRSTALGHLVGAMRQRDEEKKQKYYEQWGTEIGNMYPTEAMRIIYLLETYQRVVEAQVQGTAPSLPANSVWKRLEAQLTKGLNALTA